MATFKTILITDDLFLLLEVEILIELAHLNITNSAGDINLSIIEKHAWIVVDARQLFLLPLPFRIGSREQPTTGIVAIDEQIELTVMIFHGTSPHTSGVCVLIVEKAIVVLCRQLLKRLSAILPVHEISRFQNRCSWEVVHGGGNHVISIVNTNHIRVGEVGINHRILVFTHSIITKRHVGKIGMWPIHLVILGIPIHASLSTSLFQTSESRNHLVFLKQRIDVKQAMGS